MTAVQWNGPVPEERAAFVRKPVVCKVGAASLLSRHFGHVETCKLRLDLGCSHEVPSDLSKVEGTTLFEKCDRVSTLSDTATADNGSSSAATDECWDTPTSQHSFEMPTLFPPRADADPPSFRTSDSPGCPGSLSGVDACLAALSHGLPDLSRRPDPSVFHFSESSACILTEYSVTASGVGLSPTPATLVLCYPHILHTFPPERRLPSRLDLEGLAELQVSDVVDVNVTANPCQLEVAYSIGRRTVRVRCQAQTPTDCSLIVAHMRYLKRLSMESRFE